MDEYEVVEGFYVWPVSDGSWWVSLTDNIETRVGMVFPVGQIWWVALRNRPELTDLYELGELREKAEADPDWFRGEAEARSAGPDVAGWGRTRDMAIARLKRA